MIKASLVCSVELPQARHVASRKRSYVNFLLIRKQHLILAAYTHVKVPKTFVMFKLRRQANDRGVS